MQSANGVLVLTIGHSTRTMEDFLGLLQANEIATVADVRTIPRSRHNPQFDARTLPGALNTAGIKYIHMAGLGGLRQSRANSLNTGWRNASFRGFADYMQTAEFGQSLQCLMNIILKEQVVLMCAEKLPWRCHRSLIADALLVRGFKVEHIIDANVHYSHNITSFASVSGTIVTYPSVVNDNISGVHIDTHDKKEYDSGRNIKAA
jgi:uncharacterized protein (DUF488 family)